MQWFFYYFLVLQVSLDIHWKKCMYIIHSKKCVNKTDTYATNSITYWFESMIYMLLAEML